MTDAPAPDPRPASSKDGLGAHRFTVKPPLSFARAFAWLVGVLIVGSAIVGFVQGYGTWSLVGVVVGLAVLVAAVRMRIPIWSVYEEGVTLRTRGVPRTLWFLELEKVDYRPDPETNEPMPWLVLTSGEAIPVEPRLYPKEQARKLVEALLVGTRQRPALVEQKEEGEAPGLPLD